MKHKVLTILLSLLMSMVGAKNFAHDIEATNADGVTIYYNRTYNGDWELEVTNNGVGYDEYGNWVVDNSYSGNVAIPSTIAYYGDTYTVTSIGEYAFAGCSDLTSVRIPSSVTSMGNYAFYNCI